MTPQRLTKRILLPVMIIVGCSVTSLHAAVQDGTDINTVSAGKDVSIEYTLRLEDKQVVDTNVGADPLVYRQGEEQIVRGLESQLEGMTVGESKQVTVIPKDGYGEVNADAFLEVEKKQIPPEALKVGAVVQGKDREGRPLRPRVSEIKDTTVVLDFNHPLAGKTLYFEVKVVDIKSP